jgi:hypothetical protein
MSWPAGAVSGVPSMVTMPYLTTTVEAVGVAQEHRDQILGDLALYVRIGPAVHAQDVGAGHDADQPAVVIDDREPLDPPGVHQVGRPGDRGVRADGDGGLVINSAAVTALALLRARPRSMPGSASGMLSLKASLVGRLPSETTPMTLLSSSITGKALTRCMCTQVLSEAVWLGLLCAGQGATAV